MRDPQNSLGCVLLWPNTSLPSLSTGSLSSTTISCHSPNRQNLKWNMPKIQRVSQLSGTRIQVMRYVYLTALLTFKSYHTCIIKRLNLGSVENMITVLTHFSMSHLSFIENVKVRFFNSTFVNTKQMQLLGFFYLSYFNLSFLPNVKLF